ncbi:MAG: YggS family pyridoxal phosphate-dependent enzyme [Bacteroidetes bacterium CG02_land_8_20_14_3_00_31_25]|nr:YggS family pyridoxal phosphate-dependent enzyme [Bacteroidota bacterium]PIV57743.1 MAG: YggS family pyridoxal phosphate-dependent enzyme [Bacteroidetes bacterium CG02_land_8_20_14_3_00_31_25]PIX36065.1 MAG: YggS family pyridoxal phosphate-dependent enzyme [Bacteroidetes bacterium CG_4_8_14_3_um_filter_31_14]PIY03167.1 MAG: YggS family pyridoxal phosphate-dependent enzyme [Bacteroidetes bacterium CG_4_10_14_3_um_filter_31_20]
MGAIKENINKILNSIPANVKLVAVSKTKPNEAIIDAFNCNQKIFGENRAQEMQKKYNEINLPIEWHMLGHLQTNKIKYIAPFVSLIHSVDSFELLKEINKEALKNNRTINCLLQVFIASEETKFGFSESEIFGMLNSDEFKNLHNVIICGLMGMATYTDNKNQIRKEFNNLATLFNKAKSGFYKNNSEFCEISMGMSGDYKIAIEEGSTMVRIGTAIFGEREYFKK